jgi:hypothetical protein
MKRPPDPQLSFILVFLGLIAGVPLVQLVIELRRGETPQALDVFRRIPSAPNLRAYERGLEDASWAAARLRPWSQYAQFAWLHDGGAKALVGQDGWLFYRPGVQYLTERPGVREATGTAAEAVAAIVAFRDQLAERGIRLLVVPTPNKESVYPEKLTGRATGRSPLLASETRELLGGLRAAGIELVDLFEVFTQAKAAAANAAPALYLAQDSHWSPAGVELAARAVAQRILGCGWVKMGALSCELRLSPVERLGDVLRLLRVPALERMVGPETVQTVQVVDSERGQPYRDDPESEILVLGDSFLRIYQQDEPGSAGFIAHLAKELRRPLASLVNDGGASTLVRQELHRRPTLLRHKRVVIWEFVERDIRLGTEGWQFVPLPPRAAASVRVEGQHAINP